MNASLEFEKTICLPCEMKRRRMKKKQEEERRKMKKKKKKEVEEIKGRRIKKK